MSVSESLGKEVKGIALLVIIVVVFSIVLNKFRNVDGVTTTLNTTINNSVSYLDEPVTWISVIIIIIVVSWLMKYLKGKNSGM